MNRAVFALCMLVALRSVSPAQPPVEPTRLTLHPTAAPLPALKYRLLPEQRDLTPGNAVSRYYRAFSPDWFPYLRDAKYQERLQKVLDAPVSSLKGHTDLAHIRTPNSLLAEVDRG